MFDISNKKILITSGFPGSGKSTLAKKISLQFGFEYLSTDLIRQELFNSSRFDNVGHDYVQTITHKVYNELYKRAILLAQKNKKVVIDGTHLHTKKRNKALKKILGTIPSDQIAFIVVKTSPKIIEQRMSKFTEKYNENETVY